MIGFLYTLKFIYVYGMQFDEAGRVTLMDLGASNLLQKAFSYYGWSFADNGGRLESITTTNDSQQTLQDIEYTYDSRDNILTIGDAISGEDSTFTYDALSRLLTMEVTINSVSVHNEAFAFDANTGILSGKGEDSSSLLSLDYSSSQPHAVEGFDGNSYSYDANGRGLCTPEQRERDGTPLQD